MVDGWATFLTALAHWLGCRGRPEAAQAIEQIELGRELRQFTAVDANGPKNGRSTIRMDRNTRPSASEIPEIIMTFARLGLNVAV
jgi:hypothetical protein